MEMEITMSIQKENRVLYTEKYIFHHINSKMLCCVIYMMHGGVGVVGT